MAIWIWIIAALVISLWVLRKQKISFEHYIWLLLPIDMYGLSIAGATIKPYMMFCGLLFLRVLFSRNLRLRLRGLWAVAGVFLCALILCVNLINSESMAPVKAAVMIVIVYLCAMIYISNCGESTWIDVPKVILAAGIGFSLVFAVGSLLAMNGVELPGVVAAEREVPGFFMRFSNMYEGEHVVLNRLRGFTIDPNTMIGSFAFCSVVGIFSILKGEQKFAGWVGLALSATCILLSNSRMGLICFAVLVMIALFIGYRLASKRMQSYVRLGLIFAIFTGVLVLLTTNVIQNAFSSVLDMYANRSGLNDDYGRFTIWKEAWSVLMEEGSILGIGINQMQYHTVMQRACHNTWLEIVCGNGLIVGGFFVLYFVIPLLNGFSNMFKMRDSEKKVLAWVMALGVLAVMISLVTVDNMTYSYLWFGTALLCRTTDQNKCPFGKEAVIPQ